MMFFFFCVVVFFVWLVDACVCVDVDPVLGQTHVAAGCAGVEELLKAEALLEGAGEVEVVAVETLVGAADVELIAVLEAAAGQLSGLSITLLGSHPGVRPWPAFGPFHTTLQPGRDEMACG